VEDVLDAFLDHPTTGHETVASLRAAGDFLSLKVPHVAYADRNFDSPSGKIEFYSSQADKLGLPPLPVHKADQGSPYPLALSFGRTLTHFHSSTTRGERYHRWQNTTPRLNFGSLGSTLSHTPGSSLSPLELSGLACR
jgi:anaerobic selenocysteine-containing dehydrogenase